MSTVERMVVEVKGVRRRKAGVTELGCRGDEGHEPVIVIGYEGVLDQARAPAQHGDGVLAAVAGGQKASRIRPRSALPADQYRSCCSRAN